MWTEEALMRARDEHQSWLMQQDGIVGVMVAYDAGGQLCLKILTDHLDAETRRQIGERFGDVPLDFEDTGPMEAYPEPL
jgi:hypothetical protein